MPRRKKILTPTDKMKDAAWRRLHEIVVSPDSPTHSARAAAAAIVRGDLDEDEDVKGADDGPHAILILPDNGRSGRDPQYPAVSDAHFGWIEGASVLIYRNDEEYQNIRRHLDAPLMLAGPEKPAPKSAAERQAAYRARQRALRAEAAAASA